MRYPASEKLEIIRLVEESHLSARQTLGKLGIPRTTFYRWYDRYLQRGEAGLQDQSPKPKHVWNRVPNDVKRNVVDFALKETELSPRELAVMFTDQERYFVSESTVYRVLKAHDLITSPAFIVMKAASEFKNKTTAINQLWQTDFTYIKVLGWGWFYLSTVLDDYSRYIVSWKLCTNMRAQDVTDTLDMALGASGCDQACRSQATSAQRQWVQLCLRRPGRMVERQRHEALTRRTISSANARQDRTMAPNPEEPHPARKLLPAG
ncbi:Fis family transcriptional regulator [Actibacterium atlanticum]|uniref:Fis family transcriptional regulator n=1 Tax=Actibacterium atlanticum TaxID=1461693 RepID=A0A058ZLD9_9RHOB|nr:Fis family transcriptional regulator [Actibacterium atlanticum]